MRGGFALVAVLGVLALIAILALGSALTAQIELWTTRNDTTSVQAFYAAESGLQKYKAALFQQYLWQEKRFREGNRTPTGVACGSSFSEGIDWNRDGGLSAAEKFQNGRMLLAQNEAVPDAEGRPVGQVTVELIRHTDRLFTLVSRGESGGARGTVQATVFLETPSPLNVAIFAGGGQANRWLNGGATIRGGLYVVGDPSRPDQTVIQSNGNFALYNEYDLRGTPVQDFLAPEAQRAKDLCATLRVQYGRIEVGGSTQIGTPGNPVKGVFVGRGGGDISGTALEVCQNNKGVCTNAMGPFDLTDPPPFPTLDGTQVTCPNGNPCTWREQIQQEAGLIVRWDGTALTTNWDGEAPAQATACRKSLTALRSGDTLTLAGREASCLFTRGSELVGFAYIPGNPGTLVVLGNVVFEGLNLVVGEVRYLARTRSQQDNPREGVSTASLSILKNGNRGGNLDLNGPFLPSTLDVNLAGVGLLPGGTFPQHVLGLVAEGNVYQRGSHVTAPIYAGGTFRIVRQNVLVGSVISNEFCTTSAGNQTGCAAGQSAEVVYVPTQRPQALRAVDQSVGRFAFIVLSYERR